MDKLSRDCGINYNKFLYRSELENLSKIMQR